MKWWSVTLKKFFLPFPFLCWRRKKRSIVGMQSFGFSIWTRTDQSTIECQFELVQEFLHWFWRTPYVWLQNPVCHFILFWRTGSITSLWNRRRDHCQRNDGVLCQQEWRWGLSSRRKLSRIQLRIFRCQTTGPKNYEVLRRETTSGRSNEEGNRGGLASLPGPAKGRRRLWRAS